MRWWRLPIEERACRETDLGGGDYYLRNSGLPPFCDQCKYAAITANKLTKHIKNKHEEVIYPCDQCEYGATTASCLKKHIEDKHEGVRYPCDQCMYAAT